MTDLTVANTIRQQLGGSRFVMMTGSSNFTGTNNSLSFKVGSNAKRVTHVIITLNLSDTYTMEFLRCYRSKGTIQIKTLTKYEGVYFDQLEELFTAATGLYTRL